MLTHSTRLRAPYAVWTAILALTGCVSAPEYAIDTASFDTASVPSDTGAEDTSASWDVRPSHEVGAQVTFVARCALLEEPRQLTWTLVDDDAHRWEIDLSVTEPGVPASWVPNECYVRLGSQGELFWMEDGRITYDVIHEATPSLRAGSWLGVVHLEQVELSAACRDVYADHGASLPALELVRLDAP